MKRLFDNVLKEWRQQPRRKPLIVRGARQVGKTYSINAFGKSAFDDLVVFDFEANRRLQRVFADNLDARDLVTQLEAEAESKIVPGQTLVFFDEIQACPRALTALRYFYEQLPELHVVAAGSLLEFALEEISFPVGRVEFAWMRPLCFAEFLMALGADILLQHLPDLDTRLPLPTGVHEKLLDYLRRYFVVGGMPEDVETFAESRSVADVASVHRNLSTAYLQDFANYSSRVDRDCLERVFEALPAQMGRQTKYTALYPEKRIETIKECLRVLECASIFQRIRSTTAHGLPLGASTAPRVFKCLFLDIGLVQHLCGLTAADILAERNLLRTWRGALAEQFVGQEQLALRGGAEGDRLYYWARAARGSAAEVDYVFVDDENKIVPVEVKSGPAGRLKSMHLFMLERPECELGLVFSAANVSVLDEQKLVFLPLYTQFRRSRIS